MLTVTITNAPSEVLWIENVYTLTCDTEFFRTFTADNGNTFSIIYGTHHYLDGSKEQETGWYGKLCQIKDGSIYRLQTKIYPEWKSIFGDAAWYAGSIGYRFTVVYSDGGKQSGITH